MSASPRLVKITPDNVEAACRLEVRPEQMPFVSPVAWSLAEAYAQPEIAWPRLIFDGTRLVGFVMGFFLVPWYPDRPDNIRSGIWRLNIAADQQGRGYGRFAVASVCEELRRRGQARATVTWGEGEYGPERFYLRLGFRPTGERSGGQVVGELDLTDGEVSAALSNLEFGAQVRVDHERGCRYEVVHDWDRGVVA